MNNLYSRSLSDLARKLSLNSLKSCKSTVSSWKFLKTGIYLGYIGEFEVIDDHRSNKIVVELTGRINKCGVISPRFDIKIPVKLHFEKRLITKIRHMRNGVIVFYHQDNLVS